jgi:hypothetical protein
LQPYPSHNNLNTSIAARMNEFGFIFNELDR